MAVAGWAVAAAAGAAAHWHRRRGHERLRRRLVECNLSLGVIMRLWTINKYIVDVAALRRVGSYHLLHLVRLSRWRAAFLPCLFDRTSPYCVLWLACYGLLWLAAGLA